MAALVRAYRLGSQSLWIDEMFTLNSSGVGVPFRPADLLGDIHGALYSLVLHLCSRPGNIPAVKKQLQSAQNPLLARIFKKIEQMA